MNWLGAVLTVCVLVSSARCASDAIPWCYHLPSCSDSTWATIATKFCNGTRQSPIDIVSGSAQSDSSLTAFKFDNYDITTSLKSITNTGKTVKVNFNSNIKISGGGLSEDYDSLQFHLHWGNGASVPGSEHTVNGKRYPMELHIVNSKASFNGDTTLAVADGTGLAALGFLIEEMPGDATGQPASWKKLTTYLTNITNSGESVSLSGAGISLDDLLPGVNRSSYYRYLGSLTTPSCNEAVVWTVFKDKVQVSKDLIDLFSTTVRVFNTSAPVIINNFRRIQPAQSVTQTSSTSKTCYSLGLMALSVFLGKL